MFVIGFKMVHVQSNPIEMLPEKSMLRMSDNFISKHFGGTRFFSVVLENNGLTLTNQEQWEKVQEITAFVKKQKGVGTVSSIIPLLTRTSSLISSEPLSNAAISMITSSKGIFGKNYSTYIKGFLSESKSKTRLTVQCSNDAGIHPLEIAKNIETHIEQTYKGWDVLVSGPAILNEAMASVLIKTQISSLISTFIPVFLCLALFFKSFRVGIFSIIPIIFSTAFVYAMMGLLGVTINLVTVIIMNTSIGIGIDYAIHFISGYLYCRKNYNSRIDAIKHTIKSKGTPILFNTFVVGIGFLILMFSTFPPIKDFGTVIFVSMFVSAVFSILFISILISLFGMGDKFLVRKDIA
jgi:predicted RND superfamily exporter protein